MLDRTTLHCKGLSVTTAQAKKTTAKSILIALLINMVAAAAAASLARDATHAHQMRLRFLDAIYDYPNVIAL